MTLNGQLATAEMDYKELLVQSHPSRDQVDRPPLIEFRSLSKSFGATQALDDVSFSVREGEILALVGENGAGKSTLIKILAGVETADSGTILFRGVDGRSAVRPRISFLHQNLALVESMTVAENIALGLGYPRRRSLISWRSVTARARDCLVKLAVDIDPESTISDLSRAERSLVALARCLSAEPDAIVLDEPTASLEKADAERLFQAMRELQRSGVAQIFVSHRLDEVFRVADRVVVLRNGRRVGTLATSAVTPDQLVELITGSLPQPQTHRHHALATDAVLEVSGACHGPVGPLDFSVAAGEVFGVVGLRGAGQGHVALWLSGQLPLDRGTITLAGREFRPSGPRAALAAGAALVTGNRETSGMAASMTVHENLLLNPCARGRSILRPRSRRSERAEARALAERFDVRPPKPELRMSSLSGGNQQKVILARSLDLHKPLVVLEDPTIGVDVGARAAIFKLVREATDAGACVVLVSSDFEEVAAVCDRAAAFNRGRIVSVFEGAALTTENLVRSAEAGDAR